MILNTILEIGSNKGYNLAYYLSLSNRVVAVEANPTLCNKISKEFNTYLENGSLILINAAVVASGDVIGDKVKFYINRNDAMSSLLPKKGSSEVFVDAIPILDLLTEYKPEFVKIDVEGYDHFLLAKMNEIQYIPNYLQIECHNKLVLAELLKSPYKSFKIVNGEGIRYRYRSMEYLDKNDIQRKFEFRMHSSGPFYEHVKEPVLGVEKLLQDIGGIYGFRWMDIHCSFSQEPETNANGLYRKINFVFSGYHLLNFISRIKRKVLKN